VGRWPLAGGAGVTKRVAVITGASRGIGKSTALVLAEAGYSVVLAGRDKSALDSVAAEGARQGSDAIAVACDVSVEDDVRRLFRETQAAFGRLDVLFNNAGISMPAVPLDEVSLESWAQVLATNLTGTFLCTREAFVLMKAQRPEGGRIINNGSVSAHVPRPNSAAYTATKHAITGLTKAASLDGRKYNIACGQIDIGNAATDATRKMADGVAQADGSVRAEPTIDPHDVARAVLYMAGLPLEANVQFMTVMATAMPYIGRG
jgi:NAD(P)-dependent dehydrogenase (short-subunit alcohol dehydrogenase family)